MFVSCISGDWALYLVCKSTWPMTDGVVSLPLMYLISSEHPVCSTTLELY